jgi:hypothetical protein
MERSLPSAVHRAALLALGVPAEMLLAPLAAVLDLLRVIGVVLSAVPALLLGFAASPAAGLAVGGFSLLYNLVENYYIVPTLASTPSQPDSPRTKLAVSPAANTRRFTSHDQRSTAIRDGSTCKRWKALPSPRERVEVAVPASTTIAVRPLAW